MAGVAGFEPADTGIKIRGRDPLGYTPLISVCQIQYTIENSPSQNGDSGSAQGIFPSIGVASPELAVHCRSPDVEEHDGSNPSSPG
jgi:hypothetical protein